MSRNFTEKSEKAINYSVEIAEALGSAYIGTEHLLLGLLNDPASCASVVLRRHDVFGEKIKEILKEFSRFNKKTILSSKDLTPKYKLILENSHKVALKYSSEKIGTEHVLYALLDERDSVALKLLRKMQVDITLLKDDVSSFIENSFRGLNRAEEMKEINIPNLTKYGRNLNKVAREGGFDPVIGRDKETERVIRILSRKNKNNPCLIGEAGVGKTAIIEGLVERIVNGNVPQLLRGKTIISLDLTSVISGAKYRGDFEERVKNIIDEASQNPSVILFIDEIHTIVGAGAAEGAMDAANIMKPELSRGKIQVIGATTIKEYCKYIEKDSALERRFQPVMVEEPTEEDTVKMLLGIKSRYEEHHGVNIDDGAIIAAVSLSKRYIQDRYLPDKAIDLIDEACAKFSSLKMMKSLKNKENIEQYTGLSNDGCGCSVDEKLVFEVVSEIAGISMGCADDFVAYHGLKDILSKEIVGQDVAINALCNAVKRSAAGINMPDRPRAVFMFVGESGVGKSKLAATLSKALFKDDNALISYDMSEFAEPYSVSKIIGSAPGYVGHDESNYMLEKIRKHPYSVVLFDEIDKAHPDVVSLFLQVFDKGYLTDALGRKISFRNTYIIMTANISSRFSQKGSAGFVFTDENENYRNKLSDLFKRKLIDRIDEIIPFSSLDFSALSKIADLKLQEIKTRVERQGVNLVYSDEVASQVALISNSTDRGAREINRVISREIETPIADIILSAHKDTIDVLTITVKDRKIEILTGELERVPG